MSKNLKKAELIDILVNDYGYDKNDLKDSDGKPLTNPKLRELIEKEEKDSEYEELRETVEVVEEQRFKDTDLIMVMNGSSGGVVHRSSKNGRTWRLNSYGQTVKLPYEELLQMNINSRRTFTEGTIVILNPDVIKEFGLEDTYKNVKVLKDLNVLFNMKPEEFKATFKSLPQSVKKSAFDKARQMYKSKQLNDLNIKNFLEEETGVSLDDNAPTNDIVRSYNKG